MWYGPSPGAGVSSPGEAGAAPWASRHRLRRRAVALLLPLALVACGQPAGAPTATTGPRPATAGVMTTPEPPTSAATTVPVDQVAAHLDTLWRQVDKGPSGDPSKGPGLQWQLALSPALPTAWPPTATTVWVRYAYAHGHEPALRDGVRVARPWARVSLPAGGGPATIVRLGSRLETDPQHDTQGVRPLDTATAGILRTADQVLAIGLRLTALPDAASPEAASLRAYYRAWLANNGAIAAQITPAHAPFIAWVQA